MEMDRAACAGRKEQDGVSSFKYGIFNLVYIPIVVIFREMLFAKAVSTPILVGVMIAGQIGILIYDKAYDYVQVRLWGKMRGRVMS